MEARARPPIRPTASDLVNAPALALGPLAVDPSARRLSAAGRSEMVEPRVMRVLVALGEAPGRVLSRDELIERCWDGQIVTDNAITRVISLLRQALADLTGDAVKVETITKVGFRLVVHDPPGGEDGAPQARRGRALAFMGIRDAPLRRRLDRRIVLAGAGLASVGAGAAWFTGLLGGEVRATVNSVAVLPFRNLSGDRSQDYIAQGLAAEIRNQLSRNTALKVAAEVSSQAASGGKSDARKIAGQLGVAYLLGGDVRSSDGRLRAAIDLVDGATGFNRLARTFEQPMDNVLAIQLQIADAVTLALTDEIVVRKRGNSDLGGTSDPAAFDAYLRGRELYKTAPDEAGERAALNRFDEAIARDPGFATAHAARAQSLISIGNQYGSVEQCRLLYAAAAQSAARAVELAPDLADAQATLGQVMSNGLLKMREARAPFELAVRLGGGNATVLGRYAQFAAKIGNDERAAEAMRHCLALDPVNPLAHRARGYILYDARKFREAIASVETALALDPSMVFSHSLIGDALFALGLFELARQRYDREPNPMLRFTGLAIAAHRLGDAASAQAAREKINSGLGTNQLVHYQQAQIAAQWGETERALAELERGFEILDSGLCNVLRDPIMDPLRQQPGFLHLLRRLGLT